MVKTTIDGITYIPVFHYKRLTVHTGKCDECVGDYRGDTLSEAEIDKRAQLCISLPECWDNNKYSCHFIKETP